MAHESYLGKFGPGTVYTGRGVDDHEKFINDPAAHSPEHASQPPRIARPTGEAALHDTVIPPRIARPEDISTAPAVVRYDPGFPVSAEQDDEARQQYLHQLFQFPDAKAVDRYDRPLTKRLTVTTESTADAAYIYRFVDQDVKDIILPYKTDELWREEDMPELIRTNDELRFALGTRIIEKISEKVTQMPDRVARNSDGNLKNPNYSGYPDKMYSRDYAALLALSMLDGTFKQTKSTGDTSEHRDAAQIALGVYGQLKSDEAWKRAQ